MKCYIHHKSPLIKKKCFSSIITKTSNSENFSHVHRKPFIIKSYSELILYKHKAVWKCSLSACLSPEAFSKSKSLPAYTST